MVCPRLRCRCKLTTDGTRKTGQRTGHWPLVNGNRNNYKDCCDQNPFWSLCAIFIGPEPRREIFHQSGLPRHIAGQCYLSSAKGTGSTVAGVLDSEPLRGSGAGRRKVLQHEGARCQGRARLGLMSRGRKDIAEPSNVPERTQKVLALGSVQRGLGCLPGKADLGLAHRLDWGRP